MKLGLLADVHEEVEALERCVAALRALGADRFVVLGDVFETGRRLAEAAALLAGLDSVGVWGNHDFGLCRDVPDAVRDRYPPEAAAYFATLRPWLEVGGCRVQHVEPFLDSERLDDLWAYGGDADLLDPARSFAACDHRVILMGHLHRWAWLTPGGPEPWAGDRPVHLDAGRRHLVVVHAVQQGHCALFDTEQRLLTPVRVG